jgi:probable O-glycosylation ligase (exosortase A-associated)
MRDVALVGFVVAICTAALVHPWMGVMGWTLLSIMNLHRYAWATADFPMAAIIVGATMIGLLVTRDRRQMSIALPTALLVAFMLWISLTMPLAFFPDESVDMWKKVMKIDFMILVALVVLHSRRHMMALVWLLVFSLGFYGFKGGIFTIAHGGAYRVWGPEGTFIEGNNELALAIIVVIPLMRFLQLQATAKWARVALAGLMILSAIAALGTQSRGALIAIVAMALVMWWRNKSKAVFGALLVVIGIGLVALMPNTWDDRMASITDYERDGSAMGRINAWWMAWNLAKDRFAGGGFEIYVPQIFDVYAPNPTDIHAAHSIYFQVLGEHGFVGLILFVSIWIAVWRSAGYLRKNAPLQPESKWLADLGAMCQVSLVGYLVGGAFLSLAYFDLPYNILVLVVVARQWLESKAWEREPRPKAPSPDERLAPTPVLPAR